MKQYKNFIFALLPLLQKYGDQIDKILFMLQQLRLKGKMVAIVDNVPCGGAAYSRFLETVGITRNLYQHILTSFGKLTTIWNEEDLAININLGSQVFVVGELPSVIDGFERVADPQEADWIVCGDIQDHHLAILKKISEIPFEKTIPILWPEQDIDFTTFETKTVENYFEEKMRKNKKMRIIKAGFSEDSFWHYVQDRLSMNPQETLFVSDQSFLYWKKAVKTNLQTLSIGSEAIAQVNWKMKDLKW